MTNENPTPLNPEGSGGNTESREMKALREHLRITLEDTARDLKRKSADPAVHDAAAELESKALVVGGGLLCKWDEARNGYYLWSETNGWTTTPC